MAIKIRKFSEDKTSELITIDRLPWRPFPPATGNDIICTSLQAQDSGLSIGLAQGAKYGVGLYDFNGKLIKVIKTEASRTDEHFRVTKRDATQAITDKDNRGSNWESTDLVAYDASDPHTGNPAYFEYNHQDPPFWSNIIGQILVSIGYKTQEINGIVSSSAPNNIIYYKFDVLPAPGSLPQWITPLYPAIGIDPYTGGFPGARISKIAFADPRDGHKMTTYTIDEDIAGVANAAITVSDGRKAGAYVPDTEDTTFQDVSVIAEKKVLYNICKRVHVIEDEFAIERPIDIRDNDTGEDVDISFPSLSTNSGGPISPADHPLQLASGVRWSGVTHDRQNKYVLCTYHPNPPQDRSALQSKILVIPTSFHKALADITPLSFVNGSASNTANEILFVDETRKLTYPLDSATDNWKPISYRLHKANKLHAPPELTQAQRSAMLANKDRVPLGNDYRVGGSTFPNEYYFYDDYPLGESDNLFPKWINYNPGSRKFEVGEFSNDVWLYKSDGSFGFESVSSSALGTKDASGSSILYNPGGGDIINFVYNTAHDSIDLTSTTGWISISVNNFKLAALKTPTESNSLIVEIYDLVGGTVEKIREYELSGFDLINPTGIVWVGTDNIYICDSGQRDNQIIKFNNGGNAFQAGTTQGTLQYVKTIISPIPLTQPTTMEATCIERTAIISQPGTAEAGFVSSIRYEGDEICVNLPLSGTESQKDLYSGFLPISDIPKGISGKQLSLRIRITHNRYLDIGTVFMEASGPQVRN